MPEIKLEVLTFGIRTLRSDADDKTSCLPLNNIEGVDFYKSFQDYLSNLDTLEINEGHQSAMRLKDNSMAAASKERTIRGIFDAGHYGIESELENIKTNALKKKEVDDVDKIPFYFLVYIPKELNIGIIMLQRLGINGVSTIFKKSLHSFVRKTFDDYTIDFDPLISKELAKSFVEGGHIREIVLTKYNLPADRAERLGLKEYLNDILSIEIRVKAKKNSWFKGINSKLKNFVSDGDTQFFDARAIRELGFDGTHDTKVVSKLNGSNRTIDLNNFGELRPYYDISAEVDTESTGHPNFQSIDSIAKAMLKDFIK